MDEQIKHDKRAGGSNREEANSSVRCCGTCGKTGHNVRTCQEVEDVSSSSDSEES